MAAGMRVCLGLVGAAVVALAACSTGNHAVTTAAQPLTVPSLPIEASPTDPPSPSAAPSPSPSRKPSPKPTKTLKKTVTAGADIPRTTKSPAPNDGVPTKGAGTFTVAPGGTSVVGTGSTLVTYRVELEDGIAWGANTPWTVSGFASTVDAILADPRGWIASAAHPVTDAAQHMTDASWSFQRVSGSSYSVRIRLATPDTVDKLCGAVGLQTQGVYSCRYGTTILINLRRWLKGAPGFAIDLTGYRHMVINHEMGHLLGFAHMLCPGAGQPAPVMQTQTISLGGCVPNAYPFSATGTFVDGPWAPS
ncbi:MAG TPA: DUF3152 domain-containing protein [Rugosimonospora sp.]|nr:DUF3152 domain-containing protein [Rugosimonospora sp.]